MPDQSTNFAVTLTGPVGDLDAFGGAPNALPETALIGGEGHGPSAT